MYDDLLRTLGPESIAIHDGYNPHLSEGAATTPTIDSTSYIAKTAQKLERKFAHLRSGKKGELVYSRLAQPNAEILEGRYAKAFYNSILEEPEGILTCSGMEAIALTLDAYLRPNDLVLFNEPLYGGTFGHLKWLEKRYGIWLRSFKSAKELAELEPISDALKLIFIESPTNPTLEEIDIEECAAFAAAHTRERSDGLQTLLVVDNTFMTP
jgi:cystathionine beta-lyase/cystathionine gamma-synthase